MVPVERWINRLAQETASLQIGHGGPSSSLRLETSTAASPNRIPPLDPTHAYMIHMRDIFLRAGYTGSLLDTVDGGDELPYGGIPGVFTGVNFGLGQAPVPNGQYKLAAFQPGKPLVVTEYWPGWFDYWGHPHQTRRLETQLEDLDYILKRGDGINLYMFHGGTSFGFMSGANWNDSTYFSDVTSYDYGAPLDEAGHPTPKFLAFRKIFAKYATCSSPSPTDTEKDLSSRPKAAHSAAAVEGPAVALASRYPKASALGFITQPDKGALAPGMLTSRLPTRSIIRRTSSTHEDEIIGEACLPPIPEPPPSSPSPPSPSANPPLYGSTSPNPSTPKPPNQLEQVHQAYGYILYRHQLPAAVSGDLVLDELHDYAQIYLDGKLAGKLDRRDKQSTLAITTTRPARLDILVENSARINFSPAMRGESKGITKSVTLAGQPLTNWQIYPLPMAALPSLYVGPRLTPAVKGQTGDYTASGQPVPRGSNAPMSTDSPSFYRGYFTLTTTGDTFLDIRKLGKEPSGSTATPSAVSGTSVPRTPSYPAPGSAKATIKS